MRHVPREERPDPRELLPLRPVDLHILLVLSRGERHGYGLVQDIADETDGRLRLMPGNLYGVLARLMRERVVRESDARAARDRDERRRRYYAITPFGRRVLELELARLREVVREAEAARLLKRPRTVS